MVAVMVVLVCLLNNSVLALFDTGTVLQKGKIELDVALNPSESIVNGQNFAFLQYGLGSGYEVHGYVSKYGTFFTHKNDTWEYYGGILKQWLSYKQLDLATSVGIRAKTLSTAKPCLIGPGVLYTINLTKVWRVAGHLQYIGELVAGGVRAFNRGYTAEMGLYYRFSYGFEIAAGLFMNSGADVRPIYTFNFYLN